MKIFFFILLNNIAPIFLIILLGYMLEKKFKLDIRSFSKVNFYIFVPALVFVKLYETKVEMEFLKVIIFGFIFVVVLAIAAMLIAKARGYSMSKLNAFKNSLMFYNSGNFGLPLVILVFSGLPRAVSYQVMILMVQNLTTNTIGFYNAGRGQMDFKESFKKIMRMPAVYTLILAIVFKAIPYDLRNFFLWPSFEYMAAGLIPVALLTLGIQLSLAEIDIKDIEVYLAAFARLIMAPILALILIYIMRLTVGMNDIMSQVLFISSAVPSAVNTALIAVEFKNEPDFASQIVLTTTLLSAITLTLVIYLAQVIF